MSSNQFRKPFEAAHAEFKTIEQELVRLIDQRSKASQNLAEARQRAATAKAQSEALVATGNTNKLDELNRASSQQFQAEHVVRLLESGLAHIDDQILDAKAKVLSADGKCRDLQADYFSAEFDTLAADFLRSHRADFEQLANVLGFDSLHTCIRSNGLALGSQLAPSGYATLFQRALPTIAERVFGDSGWQKLPMQPIKGGIISDPVVSPVVPSGERSDVPNGLRDVRAIRKSLEHFEYMQAQQHAVNEDIQRTSKAA